MGADPESVMREWFDQVWNNGFALGRVEEGQLREGWNCFDFPDMYRQLGVELAFPAGSPPVGVSAPHE